MVEVYHNGKEVKGLKKLKYITLGDILECYILIPINDAVYGVLVWLNNKLK